MSVVSSATEAVSKAAGKAMSWAGDGNPLSIFKGGTASMGLNAAIGAGIGAAAGGLNPIGNDGFFRGAIKGAAIGGLTGMIGGAIGGNTISPHKILGKGSEYTGTQIGAGIGGGIAGMLGGSGRRKSTVISSNGWSNGTHPAYFNRGM